MMEKKDTEIKITSLIGNGVKLEGDFSAPGSVRIDGEINGNVTVEGALIVGVTGVINGDVTAKSVLVGGGILGDIRVSDKTELTGTSKVLGNIETTVIVIDENAIFQGSCNMNQAVPDKKAKVMAIKAVKESRKSAKEALEEALKEARETENKELPGRLQYNKEIHKNDLKEKGMEPSAAANGSSGA